MVIGDTGLLENWQKGWRWQCARELGGGGRKGWVLVKKGALSLDREESEIISFLVGNIAQYRSNKAQIGELEVQLQYILGVQEKVLFKYLSCKQLCLQSVLLSKESFL